jgi:hypothetical protein
MAVGINTTYGTASTDRVSSSYATVTTQVTIAFKYFIATSTQTNGARFFDQSNNNTANAADLRRIVNWSTIGGSNYNLTYQQRFSGNFSPTYWDFANQLIGTLNQWNNVVFTYNASAPTNNPIMFLNGTRYTHSNVNNTTSGSVVTTMGTGTTNWGNSGAGTLAINGMIADMAVWNRVLTDNECLALSNGVSPKLHMNGLQVYIPGISTPVQRVSASSTTTTVTGTRIQPHGRTIVV